MTKFMLVILPLTSLTIAQAQMPLVVIDTIDKKSLLPGAMKNNLLSEGRFSHNTSRGKIYILPYDNMPCLVPNMDQVAPMPGLIQKFPESRMPNAIPRREMIPKQRKP